PARRHRSLDGEHGRTRREFDVPALPRPGRAGDCPWRCRAAPGHRGLGGHLHEPTSETRPEDSPGGRLPVLLLPLRFQRTLRPGRTRSLLLRAAPRGLATWSLRPPAEPPESGPCRSTAIRVAEAHRPGAVRRTLLRPDSPPAAGGAHGLRGNECRLS